MTEHAPSQPQPDGAIERLNPRQAFARAVAFQREGQPAEAEKLYRGILQLDPDHADALHNLGIVCIQQSRADEAVAPISRAVELNPEAANPHNDLGMALAMLRRFEEAAVHYRKALEIKPDFTGARSNLANALIALKCSDEAIAQLKAALATQPQSPELHSNLGNALTALGRYDEAVVAYRAALAIRADFAEAHNNLGTVFGALGWAGQAEAHYAQAIALKPDYVDALRNLGKSLLGRRRPQLALSHLSRALELKPDAESHNDLGNALALLERYREAIAQYEQALAKRAGYAAAHNNLGNALTTIGRHEEAVVHLRRALALAPDYPEALSNLGNALLSLHQLEEVVPLLERALTLRPGMAQAHNGLGSAMQALGRLDEARQAFEQAVALAPENAAYYHQLGAVKRYSPGDAYLVAMQALARDMEALPPSERVSLHFALGKAHADLGEHERAFRHYAEGNALHRAGLTYDETLTLTGFERLKRVFTADFIRARAGGGDPSGLPVFIVGMPRSGTTLVEQILASHPQVFGGGELRDLGRCVASIRRRDGARGFPEMVPHMDDAQLRAFGSAYVAAVRKAAPACRRITDKMPGNFYFAGLLRLALPNARIVHVRRDPVDTCLSLFMHLFVGELTWTDDLGEIGRYYAAYASLMEHWRAVLPPGAMLEVQYEDLVADLEPQARRLVAYCGLEWDERCLSFYDAERPVWTASLAQVRQPIYRGAIGRSRPYLPMLGPLIEALGVHAKAG
jgi:tetratricopeptide (TPR) repeat protein